MPSQQLTQRDMASFMRAHECIRRDVARFRRLMDETGPLDPARLEDLDFYWQEFVAVVEHHHRGEDDLILPVVEASLPDGRELLARLEAEHERLSQLVAHASPVTGLNNADASIRQANRTEVIELCELLMGHLDAEDRELVPRFPECFDQAGWLAVDRQITGSLRDEDLLPFALPWTAEGLDPAVMERALPRFGSEVREAYHERWLPVFAARSARLWGYALPGTDPAPAGERPGGQ